MLDKIRKFDLKKAGYGVCIIGLFNIMVHMFVIFQIIPYAWVNGGRTASQVAAQEISVSSILITVINILIALVATQIIPIKLNRIAGITLSAFLILTLPFSFIGIIQQFLGTMFEKIVMSVVTIIGFCFDTRIAFEKRW